MNSGVRLVTAAAAVVVLVALISCEMLAPSAESAAPIEGPSTPATVSPTAPVAPSQAADTNPPAGTLDPGTGYAMTRGPVAFTITFPAGWQFDGDFAFSGHPGTLEDTDIWIYTNTWMYGGVDQAPMSPAVFDDPCSHAGMTPFEASLAGQAEALSSIPRTEVVTPPSAITVDSRPGQHVAIAIPEDLRCSRGQFWLLFNTACGEPTLECSNYPNWPGETLRDWYITVDGEVLNIRAQTMRPDASPDLFAELQAIVDSIRFE